MTPNRDSTSHAVSSAVAAKEEASAKAEALVQKVVGEKNEAR